MLIVMAQVRRNSRRSSMSEAAAWSTLRTKLKAARAHVQRFEDKLQAGIPDANFCLNGREVWLEGKFLKEYPKRETTKVKVGIRPEQATWHESRLLAGGEVFIWVREPDGWRLIGGYASRQLQKGIPLAEYRETGYFFKRAQDLVDFLIE
jgi:hypothetical protein